METHCIWVIRILNEEQATNAICIEVLAKILALNSLHLYPGYIMASYTLGPNLVCNW